MTKFHIDQIFQEKEDKYTDAAAVYGIDHQNLYNLNKEDIDNFKPKQSYLFQCVPLQIEFHFAHLDSKQILWLFSVLYFYAHSI